MNRIKNPFIPVAFAWCIIMAVFIFLTSFIYQSSIENIFISKEYIYILLALLIILSVISFLQNFFWAKKFSNAMQDEELLVSWYYNNDYWDANLWEHSSTFSGSHNSYGHVDFMYLFPLISLFLYMTTVPGFFSLEHFLKYMAYYFFTVPAIVIIVYILKLPVNNLLPYTTPNIFRFLYEKPRFACITNNGVFIRYKFIRWNSPGLGLAGIKYIETKRPNHLLLRFIVMEKGMLALKKLKIPVPYLQKETAEEVVRVLIQQVKTAQYYGYTPMNPDELDSVFDTEYDESEDTGCRSHGDEEIIFTKIK